MISIGGIIGAGLFVGSSAAIAAVGPAVVLSYLIAGLLILLVMRMLAEMASLLPGARSFTPSSRAPDWAVRPASSSAGSTGISGHRGAGRGHRGRGAAASMDCAAHPAAGRRAGADHDRREPDVGPLLWGVRVLVLLHQGRGHRALHPARRRRRAGPAGRHCTARAHSHGAWRLPAAWPAGGARGRHHGLLLAHRRGDHHGGGRRIARSATRPDTHDHGRDLAHPAVLHRLDLPHRHRGALEPNRAGRIPLHARARHTALSLGRPGDDIDHPDGRALLPQLGVLRDLARAVHARGQRRRAACAGACECAARAGALGDDRLRRGTGGHPRRHPGRPRACSPS